mmetsp:Transcript_41639/g.63578  ORF Transcript_41639/g.63578 Transcript_41639/m.63578 type:complete len:86 (+) Transcript_41639:3611-3868(+)
MEKDKSSFFIVVIALVILMITLCIGGVRYFRYQQQRDQIEADIRLKKKQDYVKSSAVEMFSPQSSHTNISMNKIANSSTAKLTED